MSVLGMLLRHVVASRVRNINRVPYALLLTPRPTRLRRCQNVIQIYPRGAYKYTVPQEETKSFECAVESESDSCSGESECSYQTRSSHLT
jgi:hypothetical protein